MSSYKQKLTAAEGAIQQTLDLLTANVESGKGTVTLSHADVSSQIGVLKDSLERISSSTPTNETCTRTFNTNNSFLKRGHTLNIGDISNGDLKHLNLVHITKLEQRLCALFGDLSSFQTHHRHLKQQQITTGNVNADAKLLMSVQKACEDLQQLSFLLPTVPWATRRCLAEVTVDDVMRALPKLTYTKQQDVRDLLAAVLKLSEHRYALLTNKCNGLELELCHLRGNETKALHHVQSTSSSLLHQLSTYHENIKETLITPLKVLLEKFTALSNSPTDENLKTFLKDFQEACSKLLDTCDAIHSHEVREDILTSTEQMYVKKVRKASNEIKSSQTVIEDRENELLQDERETRDEMLSRLSKLSVKTSANVKPFDLSRTRDSKVPNTAKGPKGNSTAATAFMCRYEELEHAQSNPPHENAAWQPPVQKSSSAPPSWLQEMKEEITSKPSTKPSGSKVRRSVRK